MKDYDGNLYSAKRAATDALLNLSRNPESGQMDMAAALDSLNKAWDELTDYLIRQNKARDLRISELTDELTEMEHRWRKAAGL